MKFDLHRQNGGWLNAERVRGYSLLLLSLYALAIVVWVALSHGGIDPNGKPLGTDFASFYAAGSLALEGRAVEAYDAALHLAREKQLFGEATPYYGWFYPPIFLLLAAALATLPYALSLSLWLGATLALYVAAIGLIVQTSHPLIQRGWWLPALAFPAVFVNLGHGQNGFLTAALLGGALALLSKRPWLSGVLFGLLAYKPQFLLVIPLVLICGGYWRTIIAATLTAVVLSGLATVTFGIEIWPPFAQAMQASRRLVLEGGDVGFEKFQSAFAAVRFWGGTVTVAYAFQAVVSLVAVLGAVWTWRAARDPSLRAAALILATLLASPHVLDYDLMLLGPAIAFFIAHGCTQRLSAGEINLLTLAWLTPLIARTVMGATGVPLGLLIIAALFAITLRRVTLDSKTVTVTSPRLAQA